MLELFFSISGRLCIIRTDLPGDFISPFSIILIPLLAVHEKSPLIGFTAYVYHSLPTSNPRLVSLIISSCESVPPLILRLCGLEINKKSKILMMN